MYFVRTVHCIMNSFYIFFTIKIFQGPLKFKFWLHRNFVCEHETFEVRDDFYSSIYLLFYLWFHKKAMKDGTHLEQYKSDQHIPLFYLQPIIKLILIRYRCFFFSGLTINMQSIFLLYAKNTNWVEEIVVNYIKKIKIALQFRELVTASASTSTDWQ